jgi:hypothetical protein
VSQAGGNDAVHGNGHTNYTRSIQFRMGEETIVKIPRRTFLMFSLSAALSLWHYAPVKARDTNRPARFLPEERRTIEEYYHKGNKRKQKGLPPGLAKRGGNLPPGLQKQLDKNGRLPPGLQKQVEPLPIDLDRRLPRLPESWERVVLEDNVILIDRRTQRILDIIENVIGLSQGR